MERLGDGDWTTPTPFYEDGFIPWRLVPYAGRIWMIGYTGGENIYDMEADPVRIHWLASEDGESWSPAVGGEAVVLEGGGSETGFSFTEDGAVVAVVRNENGDADGWGSKVCRAEANALDDWRCESDPRKYDSPLLFNHAGIFWLVGRRNVTETGNYDLGGDDRTHAQRSFNNQTTYWLEPKRCSLWRVDPESLTVHFETDLPSRGDTCFASVIEADPDADHDYDLYNYTSPLDGEDVGWQDGQNGPTLIYRLALTLPTQ
jgi:hypothetical protein